MTEIKIPFLPEFAPKLLNGDKVATARTKKYGNKGDTFTIFGARFKLATDPVETPLNYVAGLFYKAEGFDSPAGFIKIWERIHPRKGYRAHQTVFLHIFCRIE